MRLRHTASVLLLLAACASDAPPPAPGGGGLVSGGGGGAAAASDGGAMAAASLDVGKRMEELTDAEAAVVCAEVTDGLLAAIGEQAFNTFACFTLASGSYAGDVSVAQCEADVDACLVSDQVTFGRSCGFEQAAGRAGCDVQIADVLGCIPDFVRSMQWAIDSSTCAVVYGFDVAPLLPTLSETCQDFLDRCPGQF